MHGQPLRRWLISFSCRGSYWIRGSAASPRWPHQFTTSRSRDISVDLRAFSTFKALQQDVQVTEVERIRNIGIIAHVDAGKTTTTEAMLYNSGATRHLGNVDHGDTVTDFLPMERKRGITIQSAAITFKWPTPERLKPGEETCSVNLIDTPGHQDFRFEVDRCMPVLDGAVCVIDSVEGVEAHTERVWSSSQEFKVPRIVLVNKLDRTGASFKKSVQDIGMKLGGMPLVCQIPWWGEDTVKGVVDVISRSVVSWAGSSRRDDISSLARMNPPFMGEIERAREKLIELLCEHDDELLELWTETTEQEEELPEASIHQSIRRVINDGEAKLIPVLAGASLRNVGVTSLLDCVNKYLPSPLDRPEVHVQIGAEFRPLSQLVEESQNPKIPAKKRSVIESVASVFKVVNDPKRGMLTFLRVYHGDMKRNVQLWNSDCQDTERALTLTQISAGKYVEVPLLAAGQIGAITGLKKARTGDTLIVFANNKLPTSHFGQIKIRPPEIPPAVAFLVIEPTSQSSAKSLEAALENLTREDPSLRWSLNEKIEQYSLSGMGKLHLEVARDRLENHYQVEAHWDSIQVDYKECVTMPTATQRYLVDKIIAGKPGKAACSATIEPIESEGPEEVASAGAGSFERDGNVIKINFTNLSGSKEDSIEEIRPGLINGAIAALARGPRRNSPMNSCLVTLTFDFETDYFGDASGGHFAGAAREALKAALKEAHSRGDIGILEPVMKVAIQCPEAAASAVQHDIHAARGGRVHEVKDLQDSGDSASVAASAIEMTGAAPIDVSDIYAPPDPYEFLTTLRETRKGGLRMLEIVAHVPLVEMLDYDSHLRSMTAGRHAMNMTLDTFERVTGQREKAL